MKIEDFCLDGFQLSGNLRGEIRGITYDSRMVKEGDLFVAIRGENSDGHRFIPDAIRRGANAVAYELNESIDIIDNHRNITWIGVPDSRDALAKLSHIFYKKPSNQLTLIGITGTNGKTTTSYIVKNCFERSGYRVGLIGTIGYYIGNDFFEAHHTTPQASDFQFFLRRMVDQGCHYAVAEVSSHALSQRRVDYSQFKVAVFTNLTHDHLDYHKTMEDYYKAKKRLFSELLIDSGIAIINIDDPYGERLYREIREERKSLASIITIGIHNPEANIKACNIKTTFRGSTFELIFEKFSKELSTMTVVRTNLLGLPNVYNMLAGISVALSLGLPMGLIQEAIAQMEPVEGRFHKIDIGQDFLAIVDYAHTPDALEGLLNTARRLLKDNTRSGKEKIITVFGCGGNRDKSKRPKMANIATDLSDFVIMTTDNPRFEDPLDIIEDMERGALKGNYVIIPDRRLAIEMAVNMASRGDILVVAGKGHENYQEVRGVKFEFSDAIELKNAILKKRK
ncbi:MAG: UDP-N-acetylmuramoyl-L-alanyl-D-glutamate--2,6-diaminopimelate ligase [Thermodesulfovibrionales bacterium]|nr:UDP-N-acetylmuramoyl-L-alanyl-D-glutamate--2,6-diaminopimelate ligase [Thermodesulfovibrionales bacterium]